MKPINSNRNSKDTEMASESFIHKTLVNTTRARTCSNGKLITSSSQMEHDGTFDDILETKQ